MFQAKSFCTRVRSSPRQKLKKTVVGFNKLISKLFFLFYLNVFFLYFENLVQDKTSKGMRTSSVQANNLKVLRAPVNLPNIFQASFNF